MYVIFNDITKRHNKLTSYKYGVSYEITTKNYNIAPTTEKQQEKPKGKTHVAISFFREDLTFASPKTFGHLIMPVSVKLAVVLVVAENRAKNQM